MPFYFKRFFHNFLKLLISCFCLNFKRYWNWNYPCDSSANVEDKISRQDDQIDGLTEYHSRDLTEHYTDGKTKHSTESTEEATEDDSTSKTTIIYVLSFIVVLFFVIAIIGLVIYCKKSRKKPKSAKKLNQRLNRGIELELSSHHYDSVHYYDYAEASQPEPLHPIPKHNPRTQYDHLKISRAAEPNSPVLSHYHKLHAPKMIA